MKLISKPLFGLFTVAAGMAVVLAISHFTSWGRDTQPGFSIAKTPVNRDARLGTSFAPIVKKVSPSVVNIYTTRFIKERPMYNPFMNDPVFRQFFGGRLPQAGPERTRKEQSLGSGVIVSPDGYILTANHVVADADEIKVAIDNNKKEFTAKVIGKDRATDIAVLKIQASNLSAVTLADSDQLEVGDVVLALGNPFGVGQTVTMGIISALGRNIGLNSYEDFIQTDAAINPGNSGGALVDAEGRLIGINTAIRSETGGYQGIGYAVPINLARNVLERLVSGGKITRGYLGVIYPQDIDAGLAKLFNLPDQDGALVGDVTPESPAQKAGLKSGDIIVSINGKKITSAENLKVTISQLEPGSQATLGISRNGAAKTLTATLEELPGPSVVSAAEPGDSTPDNYKADALDGVTVADFDPLVRQQLGIPTGIQGAMVTDVTQDSNAAEAGLQRHDIIVEVNRAPVADATETVRVCRAARGDQILLKVWRRLGNTSGTLYLSVDNAKLVK
jgi:serine protease Do